MALCGLLLLAGLVWATGPAAAQPAVPPLTGRVVDQADILAPKTERTLTAMLAAHEDSTSNQVAVLTVSTLGRESIEAFALRVAETWGLGTAENDNGVLLAIAVEDRELRIEVGDGLQGALPDITAGRIIRNEITPRFRSGDFDAGVLAGTSAIIGAIEGTYVPPARASSTDDDGFEWGALPFVLLPFILAVVTVLSSGGARLFIFFHQLVFAIAGASILTQAFVPALVIVLLYVAVFWGLGFIPAVRRARKELKAARDADEDRTIHLGPFAFSSSTFKSSGSSSGGGFSSGGGSFSGGGGSFSGGGASGSW